jgi:Tfp pilus assembly protein PilZ
VLFISTTKKHRVFIVELLLDVPQKFNLTARMGFLTPVLCQLPTSMPGSESGFMPTALNKTTTDLSTYVDLEYSKNS